MPGLTAARTGGLAASTGACQRDSASAVPRPRRSSPLAHREGRVTDGACAETADARCGVHRASRRPPGGRKVRRRTSLQFSWW